LAGNGYPNGKAGDAVTSFARIVAIADIYDALTTDRRYREAMTPKEAIDVMTHKMHGELDTQLLQLFINVIGEVLIMDAAHSGETPGEIQPSTLSSLRQTEANGIDAVA